MHFATCGPIEEKAEIARQLRLEGGYGALGSGGETGSSSNDMTTVISAIDKTKMKVIPVEKHVRSSLRVAPNNRRLNPMLKKPNDGQLATLRLKRIEDGQESTDNESDTGTEDEGPVGNIGGGHKIKSGRTTPSLAHVTEEIKPLESELAIQRKIIASKKKRMAEGNGGKKKDNQFAYRPYQFPANINEKPMEWLFGDIDFL